MHILITNDDGIASEGLWLLAAAMRELQLGTITIVAPETDQSATSMSFPSQAYQVLTPVEPPEPCFAGLTAFAHSGTPVSCVTVAMIGACGPRPDLVVSGINAGVNGGTNVALSGTVGAAMIGTLWGVPGLAVSAQLVRERPVNWQVAAWAAQRVVPLLIQLHKQHGQPLMLNMNVPNVPSIAALRGFRATVTSSFFYGNYLTADAIEREENGRLRFRYAFDHRAYQYPFPIETDDGAVRAGYVSVGPLAPMGHEQHIDITAAVLALDNDRG